uniref:ethanolamine kinase n=1 Tax=Callorhinchus milii TaxID=7868 RepID=V9KQ60_CALMI
METPGAAGSPHLPLWVDEKEPRSGIESLLQQLRPLWKASEIRIKSFTDGITNKLIGCYVDETMQDVILVRLYGKMTELFVDRESEVKSFQMLHAHSRAPELYCTFQNGMCYEFMKGTVLDKWLLRESSTFRLVAEEMAQFHSVQTENCCLSEREPVLWKSLSVYLSILSADKPMPMKDKSSTVTNEVPNLDVLVREIDALKEHLSHIKSPVVLCHNDLLCKNIIHNEAEGHVKFIDYEYTGYNYQAYDIGNHFNEYSGVNEVDYSLYPTQEMQKEWLRTYLEIYKECTGGEALVTDQEVQQLYVQVNKFALAAHFSWGLWALIQDRYSTIDFDFLRYASVRFRQYFKRKEEIWDLTLPH